jgi:subtilisin family serine protease
LVSVGIVGAASGAASVPPGAERKHYLIVGQGQGRGSTAFAAQLPTIGGAVEYDLAAIGVVIAESSDPGFAKKAAKLAGVGQIAEDPVMEFAVPRSLGDPDGDVAGQGVNTEPNFGRQWNLRPIGADLTAAAGYLGRTAVVAVVDSGINTRHRDLRDRIDFARSRAFTRSLAPTLGGDYAGLPDWEDDHGHGSHVAGIIAASINDYRIQGVAPEATIVAIKVLGADNTARNGLIVAGIYYAGSLGADVINLSLGHTFQDAAAHGGGVIFAAYNRAATYASASGALLIGSAGNESANLNSQLMALPVQAGPVVGVAATGPDGLANFDRPASYTNYGQSVIDLAAPGGDIVNPTTFPFDAVLSTWSSAEPQYDANGHVVRDPATGLPIMTAQPTDNFAFAIGTSMAAPHVSGVAALLVGRYGRMQPSQLEGILEHTAVDVFKPGTDPYSGRGRVDAAAALGLR